MNIATIISGKARQDMDVQVSYRLTSQCAVVDASSESIRFQGCM